MNLLLLNKLACAATEGGANEVNPDPVMDFNFEGKIPSPDIPAETLQGALVTILGICGAEISEVNTVSVESQSQCYNYYLSNFYASDAKLTRQALIDGRAEPQADVEPTIRELVGLMKDQILIPEVIDAFEQLCKEGLYDLPDGLDSPINANTWKYLSHFYLAGIKEEFKNLFVNYPEEKTLRTWKELGMTEEIVGQHLQVTGSTLTSDLDLSPTLVDFLKFKQEYTTYYPSVKELKINDFTDIDAAWNMPIVFYGAILERPEDWFTGEIPGDVSSITATINTFYDGLVEQYEREMEEKQGAIPESPEEGESVDNEDLEESEDEKVEEVEEDVDPMANQVVKDQNDAEKISEDGEVVM